MRNNVSLGDSVDIQLRQSRNKGMNSHSKVHPPNADVTKLRGKTSSPMKMEKYSPLK